jgi:hypothetical protein
MSRAPRSPRSLRLAILAAILLSLFAFPAPRRFAAAQDAANAFHIDITGEDRAAPYRGPIDGTVHRAEYLTYPLGELQIFMSAQRSDGVEASIQLERDPDSQAWTVGLGIIGGPELAAWTFQSATCPVTLAREVPQPIDLEGTVQCSGLEFVEPGRRPVVLGFTASFRYAEAGDCTVHGVVRDHKTEPVAGIRVQVLLPDNRRLDTVTDENGEYRFPKLTADATFDPARDPVRVVLVPREAAHDPGRFEVHHGFGVPELRSDPFIAARPETCERQFHVGIAQQGYESLGPPMQDWGGLIAIYQAMADAWKLADHLVQPMDRGLPLRVYAWCREGVLVPQCPGEDASAHYVMDNQEDHRPYIAIRDVWSAYIAQDPSIVYHEFGHAFMGDAFDAFPAVPGITNHAGYYRNASSQDAWSEGFASFYDLMVRKHVLHAPNPALIPNRGDMEIDRKPWELEGKWEEFALLGVLLDLEDRFQDYPGGAYPPVAVPDADVTVSRDAGVVLGERLGAPHTPVTATFLDRGGAVVGRASGTLYDGGIVNNVPTTRFLLPIPEGLAFERVSVLVHVSGHDGDDDPVAGDLATLWQLLLGYRSASAHGGGHVTDVSEVYEAVRNAFPGDRDANGLPDVTQIFAAHGFFADVAGGTSDRVHQVQEPPGLSSHTHPKHGDMVPRFAPPRFPEMLARLDTGGVPASALVQVSMDPPNEALSFGFLTRPDAEGRIEVAAPPPGAAGTLSIIAVPDGGGSPRRVAILDGAAFWRQADAHPDETFLAFAVDLADPAGSGFPWALVVVAGVAAAAGLGAAGWVHRRRRATGLPPPPAP